MGDTSFPGRSSSQGERSPRLPGRHDAPVDQVASSLAQMNLAQQAPGPPTMVAPPRVTAAAAAAADDAIPPLRLPSPIGRRVPVRGRRHARHPRDITRPRAAWQAERSQRQLSIERRRQHRAPERSRGSPLPRRRREDPAVAAQNSVAEFDLARTTQATQALQVPPWHSAAGGSVAGFGVSRLSVPVPFSYETSFMRSGPGYGSGHVAVEQVCRWHEDEDDDMMDEEL